MTNDLEKDPDGGKKLTRAQRRMLEFICDNEPVGRFPLGAGLTLQMVYKLENFGWAEIAGKERGVFGFTLYRLTDEGRAKLSAAHAALTKA